jgi:hypothetical protein
MVDHSTWTAPPLKPMTNGDVAGLGKALVQGAMPGAPVQQGGAATQVCEAGYSDAFADALHTQMESSLKFGRPAVGTLIFAVGLVLPGAEEVVVVSKLAPWVQDSRTLAAFAKQIDAGKLTVTRSLAADMIRLARKYGLKVERNAGHAGDPVYGGLHFHFGKPRFHVNVQPKGQ